MRRSREVRRARWRERTRATSSALLRGPRTLRLDSLRPPEQGCYSGDARGAQSVSLERFETERTLELVPPDGEFAVMNYRSTHPFKPPFRVTCSVEEDAHSAFKARAPAPRRGHGCPARQGARRGHGAPGLAARRAARA
jgi:hypothetical protein